MSTTKFLLMVAVAVGATLAAALPAHAAFPGENGKLVYETEGSIYLAEPDGSVVTWLAEGGPHIDPAFSPDGEHIAFGLGGLVDVEEPARKESLYVVKTDGSDRRRVTDGRHFDLHPAFSPDGERLVFVRGKIANAWSGGRSELFAVNADGSGLEQLTNEGDDVTYSSPEFSPDGDTIIYVREVTGPDGWRAAAIYAMNSDGSDPRPLTPEKPAIFPGYSSPTFSPDGDRIAFAQNSGREGEEVIVMNADGSGASPLTSGHAPTYSPDGRRIAFNRDGSFECGRGIICDGGTDLYVMDANGDNVSEVPEHGFDERNLGDWGPNSGAITGGRCGGVDATITGTNLPDQIFGTKRRDVVQAGGGDDAVLGRVGPDRICGGPGNDVVKGHKGPDRLIGGPGDDTLRGNRGRDVLLGAKGFDRCFGGQREDRARCERSKSV